MASARIERKIVANGASLRALGELQRPDLAAFKQACQSLCDSEETDLSVDLTRCSHMGSLFIGELADAVMRMKAGGKEVRVAVSAEIGKVLHMARLYHLFEYDIAPSEIS